MKKNVAGQFVGAQMNSRTDGSPVTTGTTTIYVTGDAGTQAVGSVGSGACAHEGQGFWTYAPAQAETNYDHIGFTFTNAAAVYASVQVYPSFPQTGDAFARLGAPAGASVSADVAAVKVDTAAILVDTGTTLDGRIPAALVGGRMDSSVGAMAANVLTATAINADAITAAKVADGTIDAATFAAGAINAAAIAADAITDAKVAADVTIASVTGAVGSVTGAVGSVTGAVGSVTAAVTVGTINASVITATSIAADAITAAKVADGTIDAATFAAGAINAAAIAADAITDAKVAADVTIASVTGAVGSVTGNVGGNVVGSVASVTAAVTVGTINAGVINAAAIATGAIDADALATDAVTEIRSVASGTSDSGSTTTMVDAARTEADTDYWKGAWILFTSGTIIGQCRQITSFVPGTDTITFSPATTQAVATQTYEILPRGAVDVRLWNGTAPSDLVSGRVDSSVGAMAANVMTAAAAAADLTAELQAGLATSASIVTLQADTDDIQARLPAALVSGRIDASVGAMAANVMTAAAAAADLTTELQAGLATSASIVTLQADTDDIQARLPAALVGGRMDSSVGAMAANVLTAAAINADAITDAKVAADVTIASVTGAVGSVTGAVGSVTGNVGGNVIGSVGSIATGGIVAASFAAGAIDAAAIAPDAIGASELAASAVTEIQAGLSTLDATGVRAAVGLASANLDAQLGAIDDSIDTEVGAIKAVTDKLDGMTELGAGSPTYYRWEATALELAPTGGSAPTVAQIADGVWDEARAGHVAGGSFGEGVASVQGNVTGSVGSVTGAVGSVAAGGITAASFAADAITAAKIAADVTTELQAGLATSAALATAQTDLDDIQTRLPAALVSGRMDSSVGAMAAGVITATSIAADAITDAKVAADVTIAAVTGSVGSVTGNVGGNVIGSVGSVATGGIVAGSFAAGAIDAAAIAANAIGASELAADAATEIAAAVRVDLTTELGRIDVATSTRASQASVDTLDNFVDNEVGDIKLVTDKLAGMIELGVGSPTYYRYNTPALELAPTGGSAPSAAVIADAVWDELLAGHVIAGSSGATLSAAGSAGDPWSTALPGAYGAGTAGKIVGDNINATISSRAVPGDAMDLVTDAVDANSVAASGVTEIQANLATSASIVTLQTDADDIQTRLPAALVGGRIDASVGAMAANSLTASALATDAVNEIVDQTWDETIAGHLTAGTTGKALNDATAAGNPWNSVLEGVLTAGDLLRIQAGVAVGKTDIIDNGNGTAHVEFRDASDLSLIVAADMTGSERTAVALTP